MTMQNTSACSICGRPIQAASATLSTTTGLPTCASCVAGETLFAQQGRAIRSVAYGALGGAIMTPLVTFCFCGLGGIVISVAAILSGVRALMLLSQPDYQRRTDRGILYSAAIAGIVIAGFNVMMYSLALMGAVGSALIHRR